MMNESTQGIVDSPEWRAAAGLPQPSQSLYDEQQQKRRNSWARAASRHAKLAVLVAGVAEDKCGGRQARRHPGQRLPFHPLHCAASQGMIAAGRLLLQRCGSSNNQQAARGLRDQVNIPDADLGCSPLHWASVTNRVEFALLLLEHGADVNARDSAGRTPLYACAAFGAVETLTLLLEHGADVDAEDFRGLTALHAAAAGNHLGVAGELISAGADVGRRASVGCTPSHVAERQGYGAMAALLSSARPKGDGIVTEEMVAAAGGGDPFCWLISQLRATVGMPSPA